MTHTQSLHIRDAAGRAVRRGMRYRGLFVLVLWQVPVQPVVRPNGSIGFMIGGSADEWNEEHIVYGGPTCDGGQTPTEHITELSRQGRAVQAVQADLDLNERLRVEGIAGSMDKAGGFLAARLRADWRVIGLGGGVASLPVLPGHQHDPIERAVRPSAYLRVGSAERAHLRVDAFPPTAFAIHYNARAGFGVNAVRRDRPSVFVGVADLGSARNKGAAGELMLPLGRRFSLQAAGHLGEGERNAVYGLVIGGHILLGGGSPQ